jgi:GNAT superfamily N-acetyltransferase
MTDDYRVAYVDQPEEAAWGIIGRGVGSHNDQYGGDERFQRLCFALYAPDETIVGGALGEIYWDWFHLDLMWIQEDLRGHGYGTRLLAAIEDEARTRGAGNAFLDTFSFQAPGFYQKHGYEVFGRLNDFPAGHQRYFLTKQL